MNIFITGSEGFIGSHLVEHLVRKNNNVKCLVHYNSLNDWGWLEHLSKDIKNNIEVVLGDVRDEYLIKQLSKKTDILFNLAALIGIPYSYKAVKSYVETNINGTINVLNAARDNNIKHLIHTSTSEVYGTPDRIPIKEDHRIVGQSPYSASKIAADQFVISYFRSFQTPATIIRPFNNFGPRQSARAIIPTIISQVLNNKKFIKVGSLNTKREFIYVKDTIKGLFNTINNKKTFGEIINLGGGYEISIKNLISEILLITNTKKKIKTDKSRIRPKNSEVMRLLASTTKAKKMLKWNPFYCGRKGFLKGLKETTDWFMNSKNLTLYKSDIYNI